MYTKAAAAAVMAISLTAAGISYGQGYGYDRGARDNNDRSSYDGSRRNDRVAYDNNRRGYESRQGYGRGHVDNREWRRGGRLPSEYRGGHYVVHDWRGHHLSAPPRGYRWVQHGNDYVLAAITTGIIAQILLNHQ